MKDLILILSLTVVWATAAELEDISSGFISSSSVTSTITATTYCFYLNTPVSGQDMIRTCSKRKKRRSGLSFTDD